MAESDSEWVSQSPWLRVSQSVTSKTKLLRVRLSRKHDSFWISINKDWKKLINLIHSFITSTSQWFTNYWFHRYPNFNMKVDHCIVVGQARRWQMWCLNLWFWVTAAVPCVVDLIYSVIFIASTHSNYDLKLCNWNYCLPCNVPFSQPILSTLDQMPYKMTVNREVFQLSMHCQVGCPWVATDCRI